MNKSIFAALALASTFTACSEIEAVDHTNPEATVVVEESSSYVTVDTSEGYQFNQQGAALVMTIAELDIEVYEIEEREYQEINSEWVGYDNSIRIRQLKDLDTENNQLWHELFTQSGLVIGYVGSAPENMVQMAEEKGHKVLGFQNTSGYIYESELVQGVIEAMEQDVDYLYVPVPKADTPELLRDTLAYAAHSDIRVFDRYGEQY